MTGIFEILKDKVLWTVEIALDDDKYAVVSVYRHGKNGRTIPTSSDREFDEVIAIFKSQYHDEIVRRLYGKT